MFLKRIEIVGFKSFARKAIFEFPQGGKVFPITAIVGPNGSGKSNVADAIRWAIGEQSSRSLRGKRGEDVIFAGTDKRSRLGSASVTLLFENKDRRIPIEYEEVSVTRRIFRSGESEYLINGTKSRLSDVVDLFARASIGQDSFAVITQGMSDAILVASPLERRLLIEEAAGVKQYRIEKERAIKKLGLALENIAKTESLRVEIEPHLKRLKSETEKLAAAKSLQERLREKQMQRFAFLWNDYSLERRRFSEEEKDISLHVQSLVQTIKDSEKELQTLVNDTRQYSERDRLEREALEVNKRLFSAEREYSLVLGKIDLEEDRRKPQEIVESIVVDRVFVQGRIDEIRSHQEKFIDRLSHVESLNELQELREFARSIMTRLADLRSNTESETLLTKRTLTLPSQEFEASEKRLLTLRTREKELAETIASLSENRKRIQCSIELDRVRMEGDRQKLSQLEQKSRELQRRLVNMKDRENDLKIRLARIDVRRDDLEKETFEELRIKINDLDMSRFTFESLDIRREEREILRMKVELEHIGNIDPSVATECAETEQRFSFLTAESEDLGKAIESLRRVISEMDEKIRREFESAWTSVNREFQRYFHIIFGGGSAALSKVSLSRSITLSEQGEVESSLEDDNTVSKRRSAIESGVEITVSPPGKKIAHLSMLSGGERSLVALALLFAVISHNPPPFAVLDEVEASLDEANSKRFSDLLSELSKHTQFIAITHNRETMRKASLLYGVTMGDDGISSVLSLRLDGMSVSG